ncbi:hypothetical protein ABZP36_034407 [Zizania latifolia]
MASTAVLGRFDMLDEIASGGFGVVYRARDRCSGEIVAMKYIRSYRDGVGGVVDQSDFAREVTALEACSGHPCIVLPRAHGRCDNGGAVIVMEFVGPTLRQVMRRERRGRSPRSELEVRLLMRQFLAGTREILDVLGASDIKEWISYNGQRLPEGCGPGSFLRCLFPCPAEAEITHRPPLSEAGFEVLSDLLRCNPEKRLSPAQALRHRWFKESNSASLRHRQR